MACEMETHTPPVLPEKMPVVLAEGEAEDVDVAVFAELDMMY